jgi:hypothetical protein
MSNVWAWFNKLFTAIFAYRTGQKQVENEELQTDADAAKAVAQAAVDAPGDTDVLGRKLRRHKF